MPLHNKNVKPFDLHKLDAIKPVRASTVRLLASKVRMPKSGFDFITQTLSPKLYHHASKTQYNITYLDLLSILNYVATDFCLIAEITDTGNVHYHSWVLFREKRGKKLYCELAKANYKFGHCKISKLKYDKTMAREQQDCHLYMLKALGETYSFLRTHFVHNKHEDDCDIMTYEKCPELDRIQEVDNEDFKVQVLEL